MCTCLRLCIRISECAYIDLCKSKEMVTYPGNTSLKTVGEVSTCAPSSGMGKKNEKKNPTILPYRPLEKKKVFH